MKNAPELLNMDTVDVETPRWLWFPYIPANSSTMLFGIGGIGKSYMACEVISAFSAGRPLPGQRPEDTRPRKILYMSAEDSPKAIIKPRLMKCGALLKNIYVPAEGFTLDKAGLELTSEYMEASGAEILVIDPIVAYMGGKIDMNKMNEVRALTGALHKDAMRWNSTVIMIHHARKGAAEGMDYEKAAGSADFVNSVRSVLFLCKSAEERTLLTHVKTNYGVFGRAREYSIDEEGFHWGDELDEVGALVSTSGKASRRFQAQAFLRELLKDGPVRAPEVMAHAKDENVTPSTLHRAKVGVAESILRYDFEEKQWFWRLEGDEREPTGVSPHPRRDPKQEAEEWLAQTDK